MLYWIIWYRRRSRDCNSNRTGWITAVGGHCSRSQQAKAVANTKQAVSKELNLTKHKPTIPPASLPIISSITSAAAASLPSGATPLLGGNSGDHIISVLSFLERHKDCLKRSPASFHKWLQGEHVNTMADLQEACKDADYLEGDMQANRLRGFKRKLFAREVKNVVDPYDLQK